MARTYAGRPRPSECAAEGCEGPAQVGYGNPPTWYCLEHFDEAVKGSLRALDEARRSAGE